MLRDGGDSLDAALHICKSQEDDPKDHSTGLSGLPIGSADGAAVNRPTVGPDGIAVTPPISLDQIEQVQNYDGRIAAVRGFTRDNPARAALAVRDMIGADARS